MTTFHSRQSDRSRRVHQKANASTVQIHVTNCTTKLHGRVHEARKIRCNYVQRTVQVHITNLSFFTSQALPLVKTRFLRLANSSPKTARSPARRSRDGRATSGKTSGAISAQRPGNGRATATVMPPDGRADDSQDNLPCSRLGRAGNLRDDSPQISTMTFKNYEHTNHTNARS
jgi:hypothetical protein